jgi:hypothetical protein
MPQDTNPNRFAVCIETGDYPASLQRWKIYRVLDDIEATRLGQLRVVDESGDDYLFPTQYFARVDLSRELEDIYLKATR